MIICVFILAHVNTWRYIYMFWKVWRYIYVTTYELKDRCLNGKRCLTFRYLRKNRDTWTKKNIKETHNFTKWKRLTYALRKNSVFVDKPWRLRGHVDRRGQGHKERYVQTRRVDHSVWLGQAISVDHPMCRSHGESRINLGRRFLNKIWDWHWSRSGGILGSTMGAGPSQASRTALVLVPQGVHMVCGGSFPSKGFETNLDIRDQRVCGWPWELAPHFHLGPTMVLSLGGALSG